MKDLRIRVLSLALVAAAALVAVAADDGTPKAAADPVSLLASRAVYEPKPFTMEVGEPAKFGETLVAERMSYPSPVASTDPERNDIVRAKLFRTATPEPALVVFLGGWRRDPMTVALAARFAQETGAQALWIELPFQGERTPKGRATGQLTFSDDLEQNAATFVQAAQDVARAVEWMVRERKVDAKRVGILGTSLGGYVACDLYGMSDRFACAVGQITGGDVASVVFNGNWLTKGVRAGFEKRGLGEAEVRERMKPLDPATWAREARRDGLLLIAAENDEIVPLPTVKALAKAYGGSRVVVMPGATHIDPKSVDAHFGEAVAHFRKHLAIPEPKPAPGAESPVTPASPGSPVPAGK